MADPNPFAALDVDTAMPAPPPGASPANSAPAGAGPAAPAAPQIAAPAPAPAAAAPQPEAPNPFAQFDDPGAQPKQRSTLEAAAQSFIPGIAPAIGSLPAVGLGAEAGAAVGSVAGPIGAAVGGLVGGAAGGFLGASAVDAAQGYAMSLAPESWQHTLGFNQETAAENQKQHPWATAIGGAAPIALTMNPAKAMMDLPDNATAFQRLMANQVTGRLLSGAMAAGNTIAQEKIEGQPIIAQSNWQNLAVSTAFGLMFARPYKYTDQLAHMGGQLAERLGQLNQPMPTVAQGGGVNVVGEGITQEVHQGVEQQTPEAAAITQGRAQTEANLTQAPEPPDLHAIARQMQPDLFAKYDDLNGQANDLRAAIDNIKNPDADRIQAAKDKLDYANGQLEDAMNPPFGARRTRDIPRLRAIQQDAQAQHDDLAGRAAAWSAGNAPDTPETATLRQHLQDVNDQIADMATDVGKAYQRAAETPEGLTTQPQTSPEATPFGEVPPANAVATEPPAVDPLEQQRARIAADTTRRLLAAGRPPEIAEAEGHIVAAQYVTRSQRMGGALGSPEDLYAAQHGAIKGEGGQPLMPTIERPEIGPRPPEPPVPPGGTEPPPPGPGPAPEPPRPAGPAGQGEMPPEHPAPAEATAAAPPPGLQAKREASPKSDIESLDPRQIGIDAERFQFKAGGNEQGVTDRLDGVQQWDPRLAGTVLVFRDADGKDWIADGHQRAALAARLAEAQPGIRLNAFVLKESDGIDAAQARMIAAYKNLSEGTGTSVDAAKVFREAGGYALPPLPPRSTLIREGKALANLSPEAFGMVINDVVPTNQAAIVGRLVMDPLVQEEAMRVLARVKPDNIRQADLVVRQIMETGTELTHQDSLFGAEAFASSSVLERAKIADVATQQLRRDKAVFAVLTKEADRITEAGENILDTASNRNRLTDDERAADLITSLATRRGPVSDQLTAIAQRYKAGELSAHSAAQEFLQAVRAAIQGRDPQGDLLGSAVAGPAGEREGAELDTPEGQFDLLDGGFAPATQHEAFADTPVADLWDNLDRGRTGEATEDAPAEPGDMFTTEGGEDLFAVSPTTGDGQVVAAEPDEDGQSEISLHNPEDGSVEPIGNADFKSVAANTRGETPVPTGAPLPDDPDESDAEATRRAAAPEKNPEIVAEQDIAATSPAVVVPEPERAGGAPNKFADKWYGSRAKAEAFIENQGIGATHEVVQEGKRFLIRLGKNQEPHVNAEEPRASNTPADESNVALEQPPAQEPAYEGTHWRIAGENRHGEDIYEDDRGIRSVVRHGARFTEPVTIRPGGGFSTNRDLHDEYMTAEEWGQNGNNNVPIAETEQSGVNPEHQQEEPTDDGTGPELQQHGGALPEGTPPVPEGEQPEIPGSADEIRPLGGASEGDSRGRGGNARSDRAKRDAAGRAGKAVSTRASSQTSKPPVDGGGVRAPRPDTPTTAGTDEARVAVQKGTRSNYRITDEDELGEGGKREKIQANLDAIRALKQIEEEGREPTPEEKAKLVKYTGWGAHAQDMFRPEARNDRFKSEREELRNLLTEKEYEAARTSTLNAHYTSPDVIKGMWDSLIHLGYDGGLALEPSAGVGHFIGLIPDGLAPRTAWTGVELDPTTGAIAKHLYGGSEINVQGFETLKRPSNYYDLAVSNVPFGNYPLREKPYGAHNIHNFFFIKSVDKVRPGGIVAFVTSRYTMDSKDPAVRDLLSKQGDFIGAIRLPGGSKGAFAGNAGTDVTTDIIYLRKRAPGDAPFEGAHEWRNLKEIDAPDHSYSEVTPGKTNVNQYFADNPHMMLGEMRLTRGMHGPSEPTLVGSPEGLRERIAEAAGHMTQGAFGQRTTAAPEIKASDAPTATKEGGFFLKDGKVHRLEEGVPVHKDKMGAPDVDKVSRLVRMRDIYNDLLDNQVNGGVDAGPRSDALREQLRAEYDAFVAKHGPINREVRTAGKPKPNGEPTFRISRPNFRAFQDDPDAYKVAAIENYDAETDTAARADAQTKNIITKPEARQINSPSDALAAVLDTHGRVDMQEIGRLIGGGNEGEVAAKLGDRIFNNPDGRQWETREEYLSGDVVGKLENARAIADMNPAYQRNVEALEGVQPTPLLPHEITPLMGSGWIPPDVYEAFAHEQGAEKMSVKRIPITGEFANQARSWSQSAATKWGTDRIGVHQIFDAALNDKVLTVYDRGADDKPVVNFEETEIARAKVQEMKNLFAGDKQAGTDSWVWDDQERSDRLAAIYNRTHNNIAPRKFDGSHQTFPGLNEKYKLRPWQANAIWRIIQTGNTLLGHEVGAGKTLEMIGAAMEQRRLGLIKKPMIVVPNHMLEQFTREFYDAYPNAKLLIASKEDVNAKRRQAFVGKAAANDWDAIITTHSNFGRIPMSRDSQAAHLQAQVDEIEEVLRAAKLESNDKSDPTVKELEKMRQKAIDRHAKLMNSDAKDTGATFEETGVDHVMVDEAHLFKNLSFPTKKTRIKGLANTPSQRAEDLFMKLQYLDQKRPGRSGVFATGTPISNTIAEMWTMMRYLMLPTLREHGMQSFDGWANTFTRSETRTEIAPDGRSMRPETSLKFANLPELMNLYGHVADTQTAAMLNLPRPEVRTADGQPGIQIVQAEPTPQEEAKIEALIKEAEQLKGKKPEKGARNVLSVVTDGRKVATDGRLIDPAEFPFNPQGKIAKAVENIAKIYHEGKAPALAQLVFLDMGVPNDANKAWGTSAARPDAGESDDEEDQDFDDGGAPDPIANEASKINLYQDIKQRLVAAGVKPEHVAFIHDAPKDEQKARLFKDVREGNVRVLLGSTSKMGVGTNVQRQLIAMHHLDAPWKPSEIQQRDGRILRQGNLNPNVQIYRYLTKRTFDTFMWNKLDTKSGFIGQMLAGARGVREMEDIDSPLPEAADMKAAASGDPRIMEHAELGRQMRALVGQQRAFNGTLHRADFALRGAKSNLENLERNLPAARSDADKVTDISGDKFKVTIGGKEYTKRADAGAEIIRRAMAEPRSYAGSDISLGWVGGLELRAELKDGYDQTGNFRTFWPYLKGEQKTGAPQAYMISAESDAGGVMRRYENALDKVAKRPDAIAANTAELRAEIGKLSSQLQAKWPRQAEFADVSKRFADLEAALKAPAAPRPQDAGAEDESDAATGDLPRQMSQRLGDGEPQRGGMIDLFGRGVRPLITLLRTQNAGTFMHEASHQWLEDLHSDSQHPAASMQLRADMATVHKYLGSKQGRPITSAQHEKFARTFERYLREGRAPSKRLADVFEKFRGWLLQLYRTVRDIPGKHPINDDIRGVFDRMLELEPEARRPVVAPEAPHQPSIADIHEADAGEVDPAAAEGRANDAEAEATAYHANQPPEVANELAAATAQHQAATEQPAGATAGARPGEPNGPDGAAAAEPGGAAGVQPVPGGAMAGGGEQPGADAKGGGGGEQPGAEPSGDSADAAKGADASAGAAGNGSGGAGQRAKSALESFTPVPADHIDTSPDPEAVDKAGNIRLELITDSEKLRQALRESAERKGDFITQRRGVIDAGTRLRLADALGMDPEKLNQRKIGQAFSAEEIQAALPLLKQAATNVADMAKYADGGTDEQVAAYLAAKDQLDMIAGQFAGFTAEAGRALNVYSQMRKMKGVNEARQLHQMLKMMTSTKPEDLQKEIKMVAMMDTPEKVAKQMADLRKPASRGQKLFGYFQNNLLSGPLTHITYSLGMMMQSTFHALVDTPVSAGVRAVRNLAGGPGGGVQIGEVGAQLGAIRHGMAPTLQAGIRAFRTGTTGLLPGEDEAANPFMGDRERFALPAQLRMGATAHDVAAELTALRIGISDGFRTVGTILKREGVMPGAREAGRVGKVTYFYPQRMIAAMHTVFRSANYSRSISAEAYRQATAEGLTGMDKARRMAELRLDPTAPMMDRAHAEANHVSLTDQGAGLTSKISAALSHEFNVPGLGATPLLRFGAPFIRIMSNMLNQAFVARTPLAFLSSSIREDMFGSDKVASDMAIGRVLTGSALMALSGFMAIEGNVTGSGPSDPKARALWLQAGYQPDSIRIGDTWIQLSRLGPLGMLVGASADVSNAMQYLEEGQYQEAFGATLNGIVHNLVDASFMQGISEMLNAAENPAQYAGTFLRNIATGFLPESVLLNQTTHAIDPYSRNARTLAASIQNHIPGYSEDLMPRRNIFGEEIPSPSAIMSGNVVPGTAIDLTQMSHDPVLQELLRLRDYPAPLRPMILNVRLNPQQFDFYQRNGGRMLKMSLDTMINSPEWAGQSDIEKRYAIDYAVRSARTYGQQQTILAFPEIPAEATAIKMKKAQGPTADDNANMMD